MTAAITWIGCRARRYRPDDNALRRPSDRLEAAALAVTAILLVLSIWPAVLVAERFYEQERKEAAERHHVMATVLEDASAMPLSIGHVAPPGRRVVMRWTTPEGVQRTGTVALQTTLDRGSTVKLWIDGAGGPTTPPPAPGTIVFTSISMAVLLLSGTAWVLSGGFLGFRWALDRRRYADWDRAWAQANKRWRRPHQSLGDEMKAAVGDKLVVLATRDSDMRRAGVVLEVEHADGSPPYLVRWLDDGRETLIYPGTDARVVARHKAS